MRVVTACFWSSLAALALSVTPGTAAEPMTASEFEAYVTGKTLYFGVGGEAYGAEEYLPGRRVIWAFMGAECRKGIWFEAGEQICFLYDDRPDEPQCWTFYATDGGLSARFQGDPPGSELVEVDQGTEPLNCPGPDLGV